MVRLSVVGESTLLPIGDLCPELVVCACANIMKEDSEKGVWNKSGAGRREFTLVDLEHRIHCGSCESLQVLFRPDQSLLLQASFLQCIGIPVEFVEHPTMGLCLDATQFDAIHGHGAARLAVCHLRHTGCSDTRSYISYLAERMQDMTSTSVQSQSDVVRLFERDDLFAVVCEEVSVLDALGLLYAILRREFEGELTDPFELRPEVPAMSYAVRPPILRCVDPSPEMYAQGIMEQFDVDLAVTARGFRVRGVRRTLLHDLVVAAEAHVARGRRALDWTLSVAGSLVSVPSFAVASIGTFMTELPVVDPEETVLALFTVGLMTVVAPIRLTYRLMASKPV
ncbi:MAG: hypothetical protein KDD69_05195 [Bdellovibrionales bacterium]|nr:hypothetical protein [Bdellovibrionales bacterium]